MATDGNADYPPLLGRFQRGCFVQWAAGSGLSVIETELGCETIGHMQLRKTTDTRLPKHRSQFNLSH